MMGLMTGEQDLGTGEPVRVVVVDDQELFRRGLVMLLGVEPDLEVVGEAGDGISATDLVVATVPDVVLLDVRNILEKLQLHSRMEAVMYAVREKLLDIP